MSNKQYSFKKGLGKGIISMLAILSGILMMNSQIADINIFDFVVNHLRPIVGSLTVGAAVTMLLNWTKVKLASD